MDARSIKGHQAGFTIVELLVAATMMVIVSAATVSLLLSAMQRQPEISERAQQIGTARVALETMTADVRQASSFDVVAADRAVQLQTLCDGSAKCVVELACADGSCSRRVVDSGAPVTLVSGLASDAVFVDSANPAYLGLRLELPTPGERGATVLEGGAALHNFRADG
jgi:type II secretory pathway pseudopilin PulG